ncbi:MAG: ABC transporter permease [Balneolaceae bacterium]|nr:MAG: ABC transporter permease [Balneolaceae bacterium]
MNWRQIYLVLKREYLTRVKSKGFIWATVLVPVGFAAFIGIGVFISIWESDVALQIGVQDETGQVIRLLEQVNEQRYIDYSDIDSDSLRVLVQQDAITGFILITEENISGGKNPELIHSGSGGMEFILSVESDFRQVLREEKLRRADVSEEIQRIYDARISLDTRRLTREGEEQDDDTFFLSIVGFILGIIIFISIFSYGGYITRGVIEEKTNRIVEVIASSVKPIELLTGKMAGVGLLAITQFGVWILAFFGLSAIAGPAALHFMGSSSSPMGAEMAASEAEIPAFLNLPTLEVSLIVYFIIFFILGYLLYSSLFAAVGSAADSETDTQQLMLPITAPIMIAYFIMFHAWRNPDSTLSVIGSLVPFFSPILMVTRIAITEVPFWQIGLSIILMILTFAATMWISSKIYKVGILSYGSTATFKDLLRWIKQS